MLVLGIDPGTHIVGYGLIRINEGKSSAVDYGFFQTNASYAFPRRLKQIYDFISDLLEKTCPSAVAIEEVYVSRNAKVTLRLGHARGVILLAVVEHGIPLVEYAPRDIKKAVTGNGGASKEQVQWMMGQILHIKQEGLSEDAADGLAVALCHGLRMD